ncbi:MAG: CBS domain-containing protein [Rhodocyclaceae bacterium]|nr:CBS domain-containing protein [Rhodocyclaceae bacterium]
MKISRPNKRPVVTGTRDMNIRDAAALMRAEHVGTLVIMDDQDETKPVGVLTDRDIVVGGIALGLDPEVVTAEMLMTDQPVTVRDTASLEDVMDKMCEYGARRLPVVNKTGALVGVVSMDDLVEKIGKVLTKLGSTATRAGEREAKRRLHFPA